MLEHTEEESRGQDKQKKIDEECKKLFETCRKIVGDYGKEREARVPRKFLHFLSNAFNPDPTKLLSKKFTSIQEQVFVKDESEKGKSDERYKLEDVEISIIEDRIQITVGDKNGECLVLGKYTSWIQPERQPSAPKPIRRITETDLRKYYEVVRLTQVRLILKN